MFNNTKLQRAQQRPSPSEKRSADQSTSSKFTRKTTSVAAKEVEPELVQCYISETFVGISGPATIHRLRVGGSSVKPIAPDHP
jgi:hypothetical protein